MALKIIKTKKDYQQALKRFEEIFQSKPGTKESDEADVLSLLIKNLRRRVLYNSCPPIPLRRFVTAWSNKVCLIGILRKYLASKAGFLIYSIKKEN